MDATLIIVELEVATTLCEAGLTTRSITRVKRNAQNARKVLLAISPPETAYLANQMNRRHISRRMSKLKSLLAELERDIDIGPDKRGNRQVEFGPTARLPGRLDYSPACRHTAKWL